jgi:peptidoglycan/xylan/chitin deacetylase (PgdA/CDA1 family)
VAPTDVTNCSQKLTWGLTYDDGPAPYTPDLLNYLDQVNLKATFFVVGSRALSFPGLLQEEYLKGHEIAVHTWSHPDLTTLTNEQIIAEFGWSRKIFQDVLGVTPIYFRPPFGDIECVFAYRNLVSLIFMISNRVRAIAKAMNLVPVMWTRLSPLATFDTGGTCVLSTETKFSRLTSHF